MALPILCSQGVAELLKAAFAAVWAFHMAIALDEVKAVRKEALDLTLQFLHFASIGRTEFPGLLNCRNP